ncbi:hypothetical protein [Mesorhizobium sp. CAU 1732]|uniref:hypothetical protein n=1 Tax=Mesorhizobium sp. CAU 1732 TaxID=3140358 RepID=UPI00326081C4
MMMTVHSPHSLAANDAADAAIDRLLATEEISIVDGLLALPRAQEATAAVDHWGRAVHRRLETRLAERMRRMIGADV